METKNVKVIPYASLLKGEDQFEVIDATFGSGPECMGIVAISGVPGISKLRDRLLRLGYAFGHLPDEIKAKYEHPSSFWSFGWSHGKEKLQGRPDFAKGSYYNNPVTNVPFSHLDEVKRKAIVEEYASFAHPNIWPDEEDCPGMEETFMQLGKIIVDTGSLLAVACDNYVTKHTKDKTCAGTKLGRIIKTSQVIKARLLHYFSRSEAGVSLVGAASGNGGVTAEGTGCTLADTKGAGGAGKVASATPASSSAAATSNASGDSSDDLFSDWCGWHNDHGSLTGLCMPMYFDERQGIGSKHDGSDAKSITLKETGDTKVGLYVRNRAGKLLRVAVPGGPDAAKDTLLYQIGETAQVHTGGILQATPHAVRGVDVPGISRVTFAVFMEVRRFI